MGTTSAVCMKCGKFKPKALGKCAGCNFVPSSSEDMARSLILSRPFDAGQEVVGLPPEELASAAAQIKAGTPYHFDPNLVARVQRLHQAARAISPRTLLYDLVRWLLPPVILLAGMYWVVWRK